jgi:hypothetical protein
MSHVLERAKRILPYVPVTLVTAFLAAYAIRGVLAKCGHPAVPLDDAFIHFQYAKRLASGHFFSYVDGEGYSSGATSLLWPMLLAPLYLVGLRGLSIIWGAWFFGFVALGALAVETYRLSVRWADARPRAERRYLFRLSWWPAAASDTIAARSSWRSACRAIEWGQAHPSGPKDWRKLLAVSLARSFVGGDAGLNDHGVLWPFQVAVRGPRRPSRWSGRSSSRC